MSGNVSVDFSEDQFVINSETESRPVSTPVSTSKLYSDFIGLISPLPELLPFTNFKSLNEEINRGDCIKDGTNAATLDGLDIFSGSFNKDILINFRDHVIKTLLHLFTFQTPTFI